MVEITVQRDIETPSEALAVLEWLAEHLRGHEDLRVQTAPVKVWQWLWAQYPWQPGEPIHGLPADISVAADVIRVEKQMRWAKENAALCSKRTLGCECA